MFKVMKIFSNVEKVLAENFFLIFIITEEA